MERAAAGTNVGAPVLPGATVTLAVWGRAPTTLGPPTGHPVLELRPLPLVAEMEQPGRLSFVEVGVGGTQPRLC